MSDFRLEGSKAFFDYHGVGKKTGETYMGEFCVKTILSPLDHIKADRLYRELLGSVNPHLASQEAQNYAFALSQLKYRITGKLPEFFKNKELDGGHLDSHVLIEILNMAIDAESFYQEEQERKVKEMQEMLASRIKNKQIAPEKEETKEADELGEFDEDEIPEINLDE